MSARPALALTLGDPAGVGPEILARALAEPLEERCTPVVVGERRVLESAARISGVALALEPLAVGQSPEPGRRYLLDLANIAPGDFELGRVSGACGAAAGDYIAAAIELAMGGVVAGLVTNPIHKESFRLGGWGERFPGHTEMLTELSGAGPTTMMLAHGALRVCHVTTHVGLRAAIAEHLNAPRVLAVIRLAHQACRRLGVEAPRIGVAGVNPHAGEDAFFGDEEAEHVAPAVASARAEGITAEGPIAADTVFCKALGGMYDAVVAMYHDQGHIPVKLAGFKYDHARGRWEMSGVNVTLGLPFVRTSVDHGTAFDKAGTGTADHRSLLEALDYAIALA